MWDGQMQGPSTPKFPRESVKWPQGTLATQTRFLILTAGSPSSLSPPVAGMLYPQTRFLGFSYQVNKIKGSVET